MNREEAKKILPIIKAYAEGHDVKFRGEVLRIPWFTCEASLYEIVPKRKQIDLHVLIDSGIDCEFSDYKDFDIQHVGALANITPATRHEYKMTDGTCFRYCRPRMNHIHYWGGGERPLPKGLIIVVHYRDSSNTGGVPTDPGKSGQHLDWYHYLVDGDITGFEVVGLQEGYCWPWECDK